MKKPEPVKNEHVEKVLTAIEREREEQRRMCPHSKPFIVRLPISWEEYFEPFKKFTNRA